MKKRYKARLLKFFLILTMLSFAGSETTGPYSTFHLSDNNWEYDYFDFTGDDLAGPFSSFYAADERWFYDYYDGDFSTGFEPGGYYGPYAPYYLPEWEKEGF